MLLTCYFKNSILVTALTYDAYPRSARIVQKEQNLHSYKEALIAYCFIFEYQAKDI